MVLIAKHENQFQYYWQKGTTDIVKKVVVLKCVLVSC